MSSLEVVKDEENRCQKRSPKRPRSITLDPRAYIFEIFETKKWYFLMNLDWQKLVSKNKTIIIIDFELSQPDGDCCKRSIEVKVWDQNYQNLGCLGEELKFESFLRTEHVDLDLEIIRIYYPFGCSADPIEKTNRGFGLAWVCYKTNVNTDLGKLIMSMLFFWNLVCLKVWLVPFVHEVSKYCPWLFYIWSKTAITFIQE